MKQSVSEARKPIINFGLLVNDLFLFAMLAILKKMLLFLHLLFVQIFLEHVDNIQSFVEGNECLYFLDFMDYWTALLDSCNH